MSDLREQVIAKIESMNPLGLGPTSAALRAIIEAHKCPFNLQYRKESPDGGWSWTYRRLEGVEPVREEIPHPCPVALAAHHLGIEE